MDTVIWLNNVAALNFHETSRSGVLLETSTLQCNRVDTTPFDDGATSF